MTDKNEKKEKITQNDVKTLEDGTYALGSCLYLRKRDGRGSYFLRMTVDGKRRDIAVGSAKELKLPTAKKKAEKLRVDIAGGARPWLVDKNAVLFKEYWEKAIETYAKTRHWKNEAHDLSAMKFRVRTYILPHIADVRVKDLTREHVLDVIGGMWMTQPVLANNLRIIIEKICGIALVEGILQSNPAIVKGNLEFFLPPKYKLHRVEHYVAATLKETQALVRMLIITPCTTARLLLFIIMTSRRLSEALLAKWKDIDIDDRIWTVPDAHMKVSRGEDRRVPIPSQLISLMRSWPKKGDYIFTADGKRPIRTKAAVEFLRRRCAKEGVTVHGFRSTFIDWCAENGVSQDVAEKCLDHESGSKVRQAYQRSDLLEQRREVLQRYADALFEPTTD